MTNTFAFVDSRYSVYAKVEYAKHWEWQFVDNVDRETAISLWKDIPQDLRSNYQLRGAHGTITK